MAQTEYSTAESVKEALSEYAYPANVAQLQRFFKTGPGEYGEGDVFIGVRVPDTRRVCRRAQNLPLIEVQELLNSPVHEHRLAAVIILVVQYKKADRGQQKQIFDAYVKNLKAGRINSWDIIDVSAEYIVGAETDTLGSIDLLRQLAENDSIWERRTAIMSTFHYIKRGEHEPTLELALKLLHDKHDLIQKATGWMLREVGKRVDEQVLRSFLDEHASTMPRTMLRYAIERLNEPVRQNYLNRRSGV
jgi:3-methyladenine DNA glycosylase AlkD